MTGITEHISYKGVNLLPRYSDEDEKYFVNIVWEDGNAAYCCGETVSELIRQIREIVDYREERGKHSGWKSNLLRFKKPLKNCFKPFNPHDT